MVPVIQVSPLDPANIDYFIIGMIQKIQESLIIIVSYKH